MRTPVIQSERLTLDAFTPDDTDLVFEYVDDAELQRFVSVPVPYYRNYAEYYTGQYAREAVDNPGIVLWAVRENDELVGALELRIPEFGTGDVGFWVGAPHRGRGIMTEAIGMLVEYAFDPLGLDLDLITWQATADNWASAHVVQRNGFRYDGVAPKAIEMRELRVDAWTGSLRRSDSREPVDGWPL